MHPKETKGDRVNNMSFHKTWKNIHKFHIIFVKVEMTGQLKNPANCKFVTAKVQSKIKMIAAVPFKNSPHISRISYN